MDVVFVDVEDEEELVLPEEDELLLNALGFKMPITEVY